MHVPPLHGLAGAFVATGLMSGIVATGAQAAKPSSYDVTVQQRTLNITARAAGSDVALRLAPGDTQTLQVDVGIDGSIDFQVARSTFDTIDVEAGNGANTVRVDESNGQIATPMTIDGGRGDDSINAGSGADVINAGPGDDSVDAGRGVDTVNLGNGDDSFTWLPGQGSDVVNGDRGDDRMNFVGNDQAEKFAVQANGSRVRFTRDLGGIVMDVGGVEEIDTKALGGADQLRAGDLTGTDVERVETNLHGAQGDDNAADQVIVNGTDGNDAVVAAGSSGNVTIAGLAARFDIAGANAAQDQLQLNLLGGNDLLVGSGLAADAIQLHADGGDGDDVLIGGAGDDVLIGGPGVDTLVGGAGNNTLQQD
jgi:Ca2+-binding RTX toxin-like protein